MIRATLELIAISLFVAMLLMWAALLSGARAQFMQMQPMPPMAPMQPMQPQPPPMPPMFQPPPPPPLPQTTTCYRQFNGQIQCTTR